MTFVFWRVLTLNVRKIYLGVEFILFGGPLCSIIMSPERYCVRVVVTCSPQALIETAHAGCRFRDLDCCPGNAVAGTKEGDRPCGSFKTRPLPFICQHTVCQYKHSLLQGHSTTYGPCALPRPPLFYAQGPCRDVRLFYTSPKFSDS